jgi:hypothetical protein
MTSSAKLENESELFSFLLRFTLDRKKGTKIMCNSVSEGETKIKFAQRQNLIRSMCSLKLIFKL